MRICHLAAATHIFLADIVNEFHIQHPNIKVRLIRQDVYEVSESVASRDADIYFSIMTDLMKYPFLEIEKIQTDTLCLVTRKDHPALQKKPLNFKQLSEEPFLVFYPNHAHYLNKRIAALCAKLKFHPQITEQYDLYENLLQAIEAGNGIPILPYRSRHYMQSHNLAFTLLNDSHNDLELAMAWERESKNPAVPLFLELFRSYMQEHPERF